MYTFVFHVVWNFSAPPKNAIFPGPPNVFISKQYIQDPQSADKHPAHLKQPLPMTQTRMINMNTKFVNK